MSGFERLARGTVRVRATCRFQERLVNICARNGIDFWDLQHMEDGVTELTVYISGYRKLRELSKNGTFTVRSVGRSGAPFFLWGIRRRYVLAAGLVMCFLAVWISGFYIWQIEVTGNKKLSDSEILAGLKKAGVSIGTSVFAVDRNMVADRMILMMPELGWITVNCQGSRATVIVRELVPKPELRDDSIPADVYAERTGIITEMTVNAGTPLVQVGDTVLAGERLIGSAVDSISSGTRQVRAEGEIKARTFYRLSAEIPLQYHTKVYTGEERVRTSLILGEKRVKFYISGGKIYGTCDKITVYEKLTLPDGSLLPITLLRETYREYESVLRELSPEEAELILRARLLAELEESIGDGSVELTEFASAVENGVLTVTLYAECVEDIGITETAVP